MPGLIPLLSQSSHYTLASAATSPWKLHGNYRWLPINCKTQRAIFRPYHLGSLYSTAGSGVLAPSSYILGFLREPWCWVLGISPPLWAHLPCSCAPHESAKSGVRSCLSLGTLSMHLAVKPSTPPWGPSAGLLTPGLSIQGRSSRPGVYT